MYLSNLFLFCLLTCSPLSEAREPSPVQFTSAAEFSLRDTKGKLHRLSDYKGNVVLINFWATWCAPCIHEMPHLQRIYKELSPDGLVVLGINLDESRNISGIAPLVRKMGIKYPILLDKDRRVMKIYNPAMSLPFSILVDKKGNIYAYFEGYSPGKENEIKKAIEEILE